jgi:hypothetical protein
MPIKTSAVAMRDSLHWVTRFYTEAIGMATINLIDNRMYTMCAI